MRDTMKNLIILGGALLFTSPALARDMPPCLSTEQIDAIIIMAGTKDEYEKTSEFNARILSHMAEKAIPETVFCEAMLLQTEYNADSEILSIDFISQMSIDRKETISSVGPAQNPTNIRDQARRVRLTTWDVRPIESISPKPELISMEPKLAKANRAHVAVGILGHVTPPWGKEASYVTKEKVSIPVVSETTARTAYIKADKAIIFNKVTGEVFATLPLTECAKKGRVKTVFGECPDY